MSDCLSPGILGVPDPWEQEYEDDRLLRLSARKFNKHMAEKRRRCRINTALERLKCIILHVMRRNPENFDKMEKADILDLTVKFLKAAHKHERLTRELAGDTRPPPAHTHHRHPMPQPPRAPRPFTIHMDPEPSPQGPIPAMPAHRHQRHKPRSFTGLKSRSGNIPSAVVRAVQEYGASESSLPASVMVPHISTKRPASSSEGCPNPKRTKSSASSSIPLTSSLGSLYGSEAHCGHGLLFPGQFHGAPFAVEADDTPRLLPPGRGNCSGETQSDKRYVPLLMLADEASTSKSDCPRYCKPEAKLKVETNASTSKDESEAAPQEQLVVDVREPPEALPLAPPEELGLPVWRPW